MVNVISLRTEYLENPLGLDAAAPRLSWMIESEQYAEVQTAYHLLVASTPELLKRDVGDLWDTGKVVSDQSVHVQYKGKALASRQVCYWKVRVWDKDGAASEWSRAARWSMGFLDQKEWSAQWIGRKKPESERGLFPAPYLRKPVSLAKPIRSAFVYASALGLFELHMNGNRVSEDYFAPGWTDYGTRVQYVTYDVTSYLQQGENALGAILGTGWYAGNVGMFGPNRYGDNPHLLLELHVHYEDGTDQKIVTDSSWKVSAGAIQYSDWLLGETFDARLEPAGWSTAAFDDSSWEKPVIMELYDGMIHAQAEPPVRVMKELMPVSMRKTERGSYIFDMGQNMVGWVQLKALAEPAGQKIAISCAEMLMDDNNLYKENLRVAVQDDIYILKGEPVEIYEPHFTFHGFRYVEVSGLTNAPTLQTIIGRALHSNTPQTGKLETSNVLLNKLISNIEWGQRGNFISVPTDCPQRDERLGWTGDAQIFARTASYNMDVARFFNKYVTDMIDAQTPAGGFPDVAPDAGWHAWKLAHEKLNWKAPDNGGWADAGIIIPWTVYLVYGDKQILERAYPAMTKFADYLKDNTNDLIRPGYSNYGDWLSINEETPKDVMDTAYFAYSTMLMAQIAKVLGNKEDARKYAERFEDIKKAFNHAFVDSDGRIKGDTQTGYVVALRMKLLQPEQREQALKHLVANIESKGDHLSTGFLGVGYLLPALTEAGRSDVAYRLLNQDTFPSWLYSVKHGATTIWERWDSWNEEKGLQDAGMNSFNHYSLGSVGEWMYQNIMGLHADPEHPGYKHAIIHPRPGGGLTYAKGEFMSVYGKYEVEWKLERSSLTMHVRVPANTSATIYVPGTVQDKAYYEAQGVQYIGIEDNCSVFRAGSGSYTFEAATVPSIIHRKMHEAIV